MKILMLGWELPPHNSGGLGIACLNMARALAEQGANIDFVVPYQGEHENVDFMNILSATDNLPIFRFGNGAYVSTEIYEKFFEGDKGAQSIREIQREYCNYVDNYLENHHPDVVHAHDWLTYEAGLIAKKKYHIPLIAHVHATEFDRSGMKSGNQLIHEIEYEGLVNADRIMAVSENTKRLIHEKYDIPLSKIEVVYNSLDSAFEEDDYSFNESTYKYIEGLKKSGWTIVSTVSRFTVQKGLWHLMHAAAMAIAENPKLLFIFAGDGEERNELIELSADLGITRNVIFTGFIRGKKLRDIYSLSDTFVMSSVSEPFGLTALEAAHHGDCLILTKQSGVSEIIWSALKYDYWDERKLAEEILAISKRPALRKALKDSIKKEYRQISWEKIARKCVGIYNETVKRKKK